MTTTTTPRNRAVLYLRISADPTKQETGIDRQRADSYGLAERQGLEVVGEYVDNDKSAYSKVPRPRFERMLTDAKGDMFDVIVVWAADRLYRRVEDLTRITAIVGADPSRSGTVRVAQVMGGEIDLTTADGIWHAQSMGAMAEYESRRKSERVRARAQQRATVEGRMVASRLTTGWRWIEPCPAGDLCRHVNTCERAGLRPVPGSRAGIEPEPSEAKLVVEGYRMVERGETLAAVARMFDASGIPARVTDHWKPSTIRRCLLNPRNAGLVAYKGNIVGEAADGHQLVTVEQYEKVHRILTDTKRRTNPGRPANTVLSGIARCSVCEGPMNAGRKRSAPTRKQVPAPTYVCAREFHTSKRRHIVDDYVLGEVRRWLVEHGPKLATYAEPSAGPAQRAAAVEMDKLNDAIATYRRMGADLTMPPEDVAEVVTDLRTKLVDAERRAVVASGRPETAKLLSSKDVGREFDRLVADTNVVPLRGVLSELLEKVVIVKGKPGSDGVEVVWATWIHDAVTV